MLDRVIAVAKGEEKADLVLKGGTVVNVLTGKLQQGDVAIVDKKIVGVGEYDGEREEDCRGRFILPGLIDTHLHIESSMLSPREFAKTVIACGTTAMVIDPHEIANVKGMDGVQYMIDQLSGMPMLAKVMLPSCVPATPFETAGCVMDARVIKKNLSHDDIFGLGEFMNFVGVINRDPDTLAKLEAAAEVGKTVDGHSMTLDGKALNAYIAAGIRTDHECTNVADMTERIDRGMYIQLREGCATKNVETLIKGVTPRMVRRCVFCTDDKHIDDLLDVGHINNNLRVAVKAGFDPVDAVTIATLNAAECYDLKGRGAVAPGYFADITVVDNLCDFRPIMVFFEGKQVAKDGAYTGLDLQPLPHKIGNTVKFKPLTASDFVLKSKSDNVNVIKLTPKNVVTTLETVTVQRDSEGKIQLDGDAVKLAVVERHKGTGNIGLGVLVGYGLHGGAIAQTVAHDSHNLIIMGDNDEDMAVAANALKELGGGLIAVKDGRVAGSLALPIGGLMTDLNAQELKKQFDKLLTVAKSLGVNDEVEPFMTMSFLCLPVIPSVRITDRGLFDVDRFSFLPVEAEK